MCDFAANRGHREPSSTNQAGGGEGMQNRGRRGDMSPGRRDLVELEREVEYSS